MPGASAAPLVLTINGGSSSIKAALFTGGEPPLRRLTARIERIGRDDAEISIREPAREGADSVAPRAVAAPDHASCVGPLVEAVLVSARGEPIDAIGHRIVQGGPRLSDPVRVDDAVLDELRRLAPFDPEHLPAEIALLEALGRRFPGAPQVALFDTAFHRGMPRAAAILPIPRRYEDAGVYRYGFHGLSYAYLLEELGRLAGSTAAHGRVIFAHLGNGSSLAAVKGGRPIDTTMAFTPTAGLVMGTRSGDLDPGLVLYLARSEGMSAERFHRMVNSESGLLGVSGTSGDVRDLLARERTDPRAADALGLFCWQARKGIGALAAALGGLDTLVFSAGIGENSAAIRARICDGLEFLGIEIDPARNESREPVISRRGARITVRVIPTDEELYIARTVLDHLAASSTPPKEEA